MNEFIIKATIVIVGAIMIIASVVVAMIFYRYAINYCFSDTGLIAKKISNDYHYSIWELLFDIAVYTAFPFVSIYLLDKEFNHYQTGCILVIETFIFVASHIAIKYTINDDNQILARGYINSFDDIPNYIFMENEYKLNSVALSTDYIGKRIFFSDTRNLYEINNIIGNRAYLKPSELTDEIKSTVYRIIWK